jgi:hypothetical protein
MPMEKPKPWFLFRRLVLVVFGKIMDELMESDSENIA